MKETEIFSAGMIWYKMQPDTQIAAAVNDLLTDYCGSVKSYDTTVRPQKMPAIIQTILSRSDSVIIAGGLERSNSEDNIVFILSHALGIPLETGYRSRSRYCFDSLRAARLPSLSGAVLFPTKRGGPEGFLLTAGQQNIIVLPSQRRRAISTAVSMREFLIPRVIKRRQNAITEPARPSEHKEYAKFRRSLKRQLVTREYSEEQLQTAMENAAFRARQKANRDWDDFMYDDSNRKNSRHSD